MVSYKKGIGWEMGQYDDDLAFYVSFNIIKVIYNSDNERLCSVKHHTSHELNSASSGIQNKHPVMRSEALTTRIHGRFWSGAAQ